MGGRAERGRCRGTECNFVTWGRKGGQTKKPRARSGAGPQKSQRTVDKPPVVEKWQTAEIQGKKRKPIGLLGRGEKNGRKVEEKKAEEGEFKP